MNNEVLAQFEYVEVYRQIKNIKKHENTLLHKRQKFGKHITDSPKEIEKTNPYVHAQSKNSVVKLEQL